LGFVPCGRTRPASPAHGLYAVLQIMRQMRKCRLDNDNDDTVVDPERYRCTDIASMSKYFIAFRSAMRLGPLGFHPNCCRVCALEAGLSHPANIASQPKCPCASSGLRETTGTFKPLPMTSAISRRLLLPP